MRITLSPAQAAVLTGEIEWNANTSAAVTTGRENTLASLRRMGMLNGNLLTIYGNAARVSLSDTVMGATRNVSVPDNGVSDTFYTDPQEAEPEGTSDGRHQRDDADQCTEGHPIPAGVETNAYGMCMDCVAVGNAKIAAEYAANLAKWGAEAAATRAQEAADLRAQSEAMETTHADLLAQYTPVTDADLDHLASLGSGQARGPIAEADILRPLTPRMRALVRSEARTFMNTTPGWNWSGSLYEARKNVLAGRTPGLDMNRTLMAYDPTGEKAAEADRTGQSWETFRDAAQAVPVETADCMAMHADGSQSIVNVCEDCHEISRTDCPHGTPVLTLDYTDGRTVLVKVGEHTMTIRSGSDARLRAAFWARGLGYRPERGRALKWHRSGKTATARLSLV